MKISSCKAKGRRAVQEVVDLLYKYWPIGQPGDIRAATGCVPGEDIHFSPKARETYPFTVEVKNQERLDIWKALKQAVSHLGRAKSLNSTLTPILFFKKNHTALYVALRAEDFFKLVRHPENDPQGVKIFTNSS
jgi:hypothetical protein